MTAIGHAPGDGRQEDQTSKHEGIRESGGTSRKLGQQVGAIARAYRGLLERRLNSTASCRWTKGATAVEAHPPTTTQPDARPVCDVWSERAARAITSRRQDSRLGLGAADTGRCKRTG